MASYFVLLQIFLCCLVSIMSNRGPNGVIDDSPQAHLLFHASDIDNNTVLTHSEFHIVFQHFDADGNGNVTFEEFSSKWKADGFGTIEQALRLFLNLDINKDVIINEVDDVPKIFGYFDRNKDGEISNGEFVIQWVKISL